MSKIFTTIIRSAVLASALVSMAQADAIVKFPLSETSAPDVQFSGGFFSTVNDGDAATLGDQDTRVDFVGPLAFLDDIITTTASFSIGGVAAVGAPTNAGVITQGTTGGTFSLYDASNVLLLSGSLADGAIVGGSADTGSFFNTTIATYTGGSLLAYITPSPAGISLALAGILTGNTPGLVTDGFLHPFVADATGLATGNPSVPEPATLGLLFMGALGAAAKRKRQIKA